MNINDLPFDPQCHPAILENAKEWLVASKDKWRATTNFCVFTTEDVYPVFGQVCHYAMTSGVSSRECIATEIAISRQAHIKDKEVYRPFFNWFVRDSFFSRFILNRDALEFCWNHGIVVSSDIPTSLMINILIISRSFGECDVRGFEYFNELVSKGVPPSVAYVFAINSNYALRGALLNKEEQVQCGRGQHRAWGLFETIDSLRNFSEGEFGDFQTRWDYRNTASISGGRLLVGKNHGGMFKFVRDVYSKYPDIRESISSQRKVPLKAVVNPFQRVFDAPPPDSVTYNELTDIVLPALIEKGEFKDAYC